MMNKKRDNMGLIVGWIIIVTTILIYLLSTHNFFKYPMCWLALSLIVFSEIVTVILMHISRGNPIKVTATLIAGTQTLVTIVLSIYFINIFIFSYTGFLISYIVTFSIATLIIVILMKFSNGKSVENEVFCDAKKNVLNIRTVVQSTMNTAKGKKYIVDLEKIDENLRFMDDSVINDLDMEIHAKTVELSNAIQIEDENIEGTIANINDLINQRNFIVKNIKTNFPFK